MEDQQRDSFLQAIKKIRICIIYIYIYLYLQGM